MTSPLNSQVRAEHDSLEDYLRTTLTPEQLSNVLLISFNQWDYTTGAIAEVASCLHHMGSQVSLALWSDCPPMHDVGWTTSTALARLFFSPTRDQRLSKALVEAGLPPTCLIKPPIRKWKPLEGIATFGPLNRTQLRAVKYRGTAMGRAILQVHPYRAAPISDDFLWPRRLINTAARSYAFAFDQTSQLIADRGITAVVAYNGRFLHDSAAASAAEAREVPVLFFDSGGGHTDFDLTIDKTHDWDALQVRMLKMYEAWEPNERDNLGSSWFEERRNHKDSSNALYVEAQKLGTRLDVTGKQCLVVYFSSSDDELVELDVDWESYFGGQPKALSLLSQECKKRTGYKLVIRSHPHLRMKPPQDLADWERVVSAVDPDVHVDPYSPIDSYELMRQADVVVTYGSTSGVEAAYAHKPVIVMGPSAYDKLGCATRVETAQEIAAALDHQTSGSWEGAVSYGLMMKRRGFNYRFVTRDPRGIRMLAGVPMDESNALVLKLSHLLDRLKRWYLTR
jgi:hypothetical protein